MNDLTNDMQSVSVSEKPWTQNMNLVLSPEQIKANLRRLETDYPEQFAILDTLGLSNKPFKSPFSGSIDNESFQNAREQTGIVVRTAEKLAEALFESGKVTEDEKNQIIRAAVLHNALKHIEVLWKTEIPDQKAYSDAWYDKLWEKIKELDIGVGWSDIEVAALMRQMVGHGSLTHFVKAEEGKIVLDESKWLAGMIVHIASDMVGAENKKIKEGRWEVYSSDIQLSSFVDRAKYADFLEVYPFLYTEGLAVGTNWPREVRNIKNSGLQPGEVASSYYDLQASVYEMICAYIQKQIDPNSTENPIEFIVWITTGNGITHETQLIKDAVQEVGKF